MRPKRLFVTVVAAVLAATPALAVDCDPAATVAELAPLLAAANAALGADPTPENLATMQELNQLMNQAGQMIQSDPDAACALYAKLRQDLKGY